MEDLIKLLVYYASYLIIIPALIAPFSLKSNNSTKRWLESLF